VRLILTTVADTECHAALTRRDPRPPIVEIPALAESEKTAIVVRQLSEYRKKLTKEQMRLLLDKKESAKPLFLLTACEVCTCAVSLQTEPASVPTSSSQRLACARTGVAPASAVWAWGLWR
jgi:hypothetical protein